MTTLLYRKVLRAIARHTRAAVDYSWRGGGDPFDIPDIEAEYKAARRAMLATVRTAVDAAALTPMQVGAIAHEAAQQLLTVPKPLQLVRFKDLCKGTRFRYQDGTDVWVVLEGYGRGLIAKWDGPFGSPSLGALGKVCQSLCGVADEETDIETLMVYLAENDK